MTEDTRVLMNSEMKHDNHIHTYTYTHTHTHIHIHTHMHIHTCTYTHTHVHRETFNFITQLKLFLTHTVIQ